MYYVFKDYKTRLQYGILNVRPGHLKFVWKININFKSFRFIPLSYNDMTVLVVISCTLYDQVIKKNELQ